MWLVLNYIPGVQTSQSAQLSTGDVLKIGKIRMRVKEFTGQSLPKPTGEPVHADNLHSGALTVPEQSNRGETVMPVSIASPGEEASCRVCLSEEGEEVDSLLSSICKCAGTMQYIHLSCLMKMIQSRASTRVKGSTSSYCWKSLHCELCKEPYPFRIALEGREIDLVTYERPEGDCAVFEQLGRRSDDTKVIYHVVSLSNKANIRLGRARESDIHFEHEHSVSRHHAFIRFHQDKLILHDNNSKFGTLVQVLRPVVLSSKVPFVLQIGRTCLSLSLLVPKRSCFCACFRSRTE
jgi:hypothetical protein